MASSFPQGFSSVYGPVASWRYGRSLGIDPIGAVSTCSFDCVYCQLGAIEEKTGDRRIFVSTARILRDLRAFAVDSVDVITVSGSGEPTLALNLGEIVAAIKADIGKPVVVLTNASLLGDPGVRREVALADFVAAKVDAAGDGRLRRVDRPVVGIGFAEIRRGLLAFRREYHGPLAVQTMLLGRWPEQELADYVAFIDELAPDEIQLCAPTRPRPLVHELDARGGRPGERPAYAVRHFKAVDPQVVQDFAARLRRDTRVPIRGPRTEASPGAPVACDDPGARTEHRE